MTAVRGKLGGILKKKRVVTPTLLQMEAVECGAASLGIILRYYGRIAPLEELRVKCGVSRDGSKASNIMKAARMYGLKVKGFRKEPGELKTLPLPMVLFWNFNHFLVLEGWKKDKIFLNDPMTGPRVCGEGEFNEAFSGVVMVFEPGDEFEKGGQENTLFSGLTRRMPGVRVALMFAFLVSMALAAPRLLTPSFSKIFVDNILIGGRVEWMGPLLWAMAFTAGLLGLLAWQQHISLLRANSKLAISMAGKFFWHLLQLPVEFYNQRSAGEIGHRMGINDTVATLITRVLAINLLNFLLIGFYAFLMLQYDVTLTLVAGLVAMANVAFLRWVSRRRVDMSHRLIQAQGKMVGTAQGGLQLIETIKASAEENDFFAKWCGQQVKVINSEQQMGVWTQYLNNVPLLLSQLSVVTVLIIGSLRILDGHMSVGMLVTFQLLAASFLGPVNMLVSLGGTLQEVGGDLSRLDDVLVHPVDAQFTPEAVARDEASLGGGGQVKLTGEFEMRDITFGYSRLDPPLIQNFNLKLHPGMRVALVGGSGSGKSTIARLIAGLYQPWSGDIMFDGKPRDQIPRAVLTNSMAMVDQSVFVFNGAVRENLTLWDDTIPASRVIQAAKDACLHEVISARPGAYHSLVAEGGKNFSGGQLQRLEIARALVNDPSVLLLDEATSALDPSTEKLVDDNLRRRGCTCIIVAHRLSTIRDCDEIIVLRQGMVVQRGTHEELVEQPGEYRDLINTE